MSSDCKNEFINGQWCVRCPAVPAVPARPPSVTRERILGWNASAYSVEQINGPCYVEFTVDRVVGAVVGLAPARASDAPRDIPHGFYIYADGGVQRCVVTENGTARTGSLIVQPNSTTYRIERDQRFARYFVNGLLFHTSPAPPAAGLVVVSCLYASNDRVN
jgi:hypothetical protein